MINIPTEGIATDAAHSSKNRITEFQGIDLRTGKRIFYQNIGNKTVTRSAAPHFFFFSPFFPCIHRPQFLFFLSRGPTEEVNGKGLL